MTEDTLNDKRAPSLWVWIAALFALMAPMTTGGILGWSAPGLPDLAKSDSNPRLTAADQEVSTWIGSSITLGALMGGAIAGPLVQFLGMKRTILGIAAPFIVGWVLIGVAKSFWLIIMGRVITGFAGGICCGSAPTYCNNISTPKIRGLLGTGFQIFITIGILYIDIFGLFLGWRALCIVGIVPAVVMFVGMLFMPESPNWLMNKYGRSPQVVDALRKLRSNESDIEVELKELKDRADEAKEETGFSISQLKRADVYKPFIIALSLMFFQQFSGINAVLFYSNSIFADAGTSMDPMVSTCLVSAAMVVATITGGLIIDRLGRKILLLVSGGGHVVCLGVMGIYYFSKRNDAVATTHSPTPDNFTTIATILSSTAAPTSSNSLGWLPVLCLVLFVMMFSIGYGPIPWLIVSEITPGFAMSVISSIATAFNWLCAFVVTKEFGAIQDALNSYGAFWLFAAISAVSVVFVLIFVPETKGKSVADMQNIFMGIRPDEHVKNKFDITKDVVSTV